MTDAMREAVDRTYAWIARNMLLPLGDLGFRTTITRRLRFLRAAQWWDPERQMLERDRQLRRLIEVVYHEVPLYRDWMDRVGVRPGDVTTASDLPRLPIQSKDTLRAGYPNDVTRETGRKAYEVRTSGSTGRNFVVRTDRETAALNRADFLLLLEWAGWRIGLPHLQTGMNFNRTLDQRLKDGFMRCHYFSAYDISDHQLDAGLDVLEERKVKHLWGYPASIYYLARRARERGWNQAMLSIVTWGDRLYDSYRREIEESFRCRVHDAYGCGEGIWVSAQCGRDQMYHVFTQDCVVEFVDAHDRPAAVDEAASLLLTRLHPGPMPLIRYRVGDMGVKGLLKRCSCGRGFETMQSVTGRESDIVYTTTGNRLYVHFFTGILEHFDEIESFQVHQRNREGFVLSIVPTDRYTPEADERIRRRLWERGAQGMRIEIEIVDSIPLTSAGKRKFIISDVPAG